MFGYIQPCKAELKVREFEEYRSYYCGLCKRINRDYSFLCRLFLNYDCAYLYLVYASLSGAPHTTCRENCAFNPFLKKDTCHSVESGYAAGVNMLLAQGKLRDSAADDKNFFSWLTERIYSRVWKKAAGNYREAAAAISAGLCAISALEREGCADPDAMAEKFGVLLAEVVAQAPFAWLSGELEATLYGYAFNLGRFIYLIDAADDLDNDLKRRRYNVYIRKYGVTDAADFWRKHSGDIEQSLMYTLKQASFYYSKLQFLENRGILDNIMYAGLPGQVKRVLQKKGTDGSI